jgi:hypothetical protein
MKNRISAARVARVWRRKLDERSARLYSRALERWNTKKID